MSNFTLFIVFVFFSTIASAQVTVTNDPDYDTTHASALFEVKGTSGGLLLPRVTTSQQKMIPNPAAGLIVFNTDSSDFYGFDGSVWKALWEPTDTISSYCPDSIEYSGQWYVTVQIGSQCWMAENLNVGTRIDGSQDQQENPTVEKYCYNDDVNECDTYGGLYQWNEMMQYSTQVGAQGICPDGWHLPSDEEWKILEGNADTQYGVGDPEWDGSSRFRGYDAGKRLKSTTGWIANTGTDVFGFTALGGGYRSTGGTFGDLTINGSFWSSKELDSNGAWNRRFGHDSDEIYRGHYSKDNGFSVRCLKD